jgi:hypothetical protein
MKFKALFLLIAFLVGVWFSCPDTRAESEAEQILKEADA